jgi:selenide, water dikinase
MTTAAELPRLTALSHGAGCACKLPLATLERLMASVGQGLGAGGDANLLVGAADGDDAAVLRLDDQRALVLTTDFFTPIVDDARDWGRIAAANALSDVYAMGGWPLMALNLTAWPRWPPRPAARWSAATRSTTPSPSTAWPWSGWPTLAGC